MSKIVRLIITSFISRKILIFKKGSVWNLLEIPLLTEGNIELFFHNYCKSKHSVYINFILNPSKYSYSETINNTTYIYYWAFTCTEQNSTSCDSKWINFDKLVLSENTRQYISEHIHSSIYAYSGTTERTPSLNDVAIQTSKQAFSRVAPLRIIYPEITFINPPNIIDRYYLDKVIHHSIESPNEFIIDSDTLNSWGIIGMLPLLLYKHKKVIIESKIQGCNIGSRPISIYLYVMKLFGVSVQLESEKTILEYRPTDLYSNIEICIPVAGSFTATSIAIYFAIIRSGTTRIKQCSIEPEILFLLDTIRLLGYTVIQNECEFTIYGRCVHDAVNVSIPIDRNVIVTRMISSIREKKAFYYSNANNLYLERFASLLQSIGVKISYKENEITIPSDQDIIDKQTIIVYNHYPQLCTDWHPLISTLLLNNKYETVQFDTVFEGRFYYLEQFKRIYPALNIQVSDQLAIFHNTAPSCIKNTLDMHAFNLADIRSAAALLITLQNCNDYQLYNILQLFRGYESAYQISNKIGGNLSYGFDERV